MNLNVEFHLSPSLRITAELLFLIIKLLLLLFLIIIILLRVIIIIIVVDIHSPYFTAAHLVLKRVQVLLTKQSLFTVLSTVRHVLSVTGPLGSRS
jgi:hypothetical protein